MKNNPCIIIWAFVLLIEIAGCLHSKAQQFEWVKIINTGKVAGWSGNEDYSGSHTIAMAITSDSSGNVYTGGYFSSHPGHLSATGLDIDPGPEYHLIHSSGANDVFVTKLDSAGNYLWGRGIGGKRDDVMFDMVSDDVGNVYITGYFEDSVDFDPGLGAAILVAPSIRDTVAVFPGEPPSEVIRYHQDMFVLKLDPRGNFVWVRQIGNEEQNKHGFNIVLDKAGNIYANYIGKRVLTDFDPGPGTYAFIPKYSSVIIKLDADGKFIWAKETGGAVSDLTIDSLNHIIVTGAFSDTTDFDPDTSASGVYYVSASGNPDSYISKLTADGDLVWVKIFGSDVITRAIVTDASGNIYTTGIINYTTDFVPGNGGLMFSHKYVGDIFLSKLNASGDWVWVKQIKDSLLNGAGPYAIDVDDYGNIYSTGWFRNIIDFDPGPDNFFLRSNGREDVFISRFNTDGELVWCRMMGAEGRDWGKALTIDVYNNIYSAGKYSDSFDFDPGDNNVFITGRYTGAYIHKMSYNDTSEVIDPGPTRIGQTFNYNSVGVSPNPANGFVKIATLHSVTDATIRLINMAGSSLVEQCHMNGKSFYLDMTEYASGVYIAEIETDEGKLRVKFIKE